MRRSLALASLALASPLGACAALGLSSGPDPQWIEVPVNASDRENLHEACLHAIELSRLKVDEHRVVEGTIRTRWNEEYFVFARVGPGGGGVRRRAFVEIVDAPGSAAAKHGFERLVRVRVERERNTEHKRPSDPASARWEPQDDDVELARRIAVTVQSLLTEFRPSDDFYRRHGIEPTAADRQGPP